MSKSKIQILHVLAAALIIFPLTGGSLVYSQKIKKEKKMEFKLYSSAFAEGAMIPIKYTCDGVNESPPLNWSDAPKETKSFALIVDDPDAPRGDWVHWVLFNIPASTTNLKENASMSENYPDVIVQGVNDFKDNLYGGPCPPSGVHRYFFKLFALDIVLNLNASVTKKILLEAMKGHILAEAHLIGKYKRAR